MRDFENTAFALTCRSLGLLATSAYKDIGAEEALLGGGSQPGV